MKTSLTALLFALFLFASIGLSHAFPVPGDPFPNLSLSDTLTPSQQSSLGIKKQRGLKLSDLQSQFVLIEIFSMYCPHCQREAPKVNVLYDELLKSPHRDRIKLIGLGAGNSPFEIDFFRKKYSIIFPLFSDPDYSRHKSTGSKGTPHFFLVKISADQTLTTILSHPGPFETPGDFLNTVFTAAGLK